MRATVSITRTRLWGAGLSPWITCRRPSPSRPRCPWPWDARHLHDTDGRRGVIADLSLSMGIQAAVLFGDSYLLGNAGEVAPSDCSAPSAQQPALQTACHLQKQRALIVEQSAASLIHWATGGPSLEDLDCTTPDNRLCSLSIEPVRASQSIVEPRGTLPLSPPRFAFQSLATSSPWMPPGGTQSGLRLVLLSALGQRLADDQPPFGFMQTTRPFNDAFNGMSSSLSSRTCFIGAGQPGS